MSSTNTQISDMIMLLEQAIYNKQALLNEIKSGTTQDQEAKVSDFLEINLIELKTILQDLKSLSVTDSCTSVADNT